MTPSNMNSHPGTQKRLGEVDWQPLRRRKAAPLAATCREGPGKRRQGLSQNRKHPLDLVMKSCDSGVFILEEPTDSAPAACRGDDIDAASAALPTTPAPAPGAPVLTAIGAPRQDVGMAKHHHRQPNLRFKASLQLEIDECCRARAPTPRRRPR